MLIGTDTGGIEHIFLPLIWILLAMTLIYSIKRFNSNYSHSMEALNFKAPSIFMNERATSTVSNMAQNEQGPAPINEFLKEEKSEEKHTSLIVENSLFEKSILKNFIYYKVAFRKIEIDQAAPPFNWSACIFGPTWFGYRRMGKEALLFAVLQLIACVILIKNPIMSTTNIFLSPVFNPVGFQIFLIYHILFGAFFGYEANKFYFRKVKNELESGKHADEICLALKPSIGMALIVVCFLTVIGFVLSVLFG